MSASVSFAARTTRGRGRDERGRLLGQDRKEVEKPKVDRAAPRAAADLQLSRFAILRTAQKLLNLTLLREICREIAKAHGQVPPLRANPNPLEMNRTKTAALTAQANGGVGVCAWQARAR